MLTSLTALVMLFGCQEKLSPEEARAAACAGGNMDTCYEIGTQAYNRPRPDIATARKMFAKGCNVHHAPSCFDLAVMVRDAKGGPRDVKRAFELFTIACKGAITEACVNLGEHYYNGNGTRKNFEKAVALFEQGCGEDPPQAMACSFLGVAYDEGNGVEKEDDEKSEELHTKACDNGYAPGCVAVGVLNTRKRGGRKAREEAMQKANDFYERGCKIDAHFGCMELAQLHEDGDAPNASDEKAAVYYQKTCAIDPTQGCYEAAALMESGRVVAREGEIESLYNLACEHGHTEACSKRSLDLRDDE